MLLPAYEFESFIAQGGMGAVYKARQRSLDRDVAIKILPRELGADPEFKSSFETEARAMARLNHPNLVGVYDSGEVDGMLFIVMEFVNGKPLYYSAYNTAIDPQQAAQIVKGICDGLAHAHEHGVIHRDIKPANILLTPKREPKIGDFGLAQPVEAEGPGLIMGTPGYAAPELTENPEQADQRSDIFAVGVILYELLTGKRPDEGIQPPSVLVGCDRDLDVICNHAIHPDPNGRYPDAAQMSAALDQWMKKPVVAGPRKLVAAAPRTAVKSPAVRRPSPTTTGAMKVKGIRKPATPAPTSVPPTVGASGNSTLIRNLFIIAGLIVAIAITYKTLQSSKDERESTNAAIEKKAAEEKRLRELAAVEEARNSSNGGKPGKPPEPTPEPVKVETSEESLARLKFDLAAGERAEMPVGAIRKDTTYNLLINTPMTWQEAAEFSDAHGGHLALISGTDDLSWVSSLVPESDDDDEEAALWIGAGRSGRDSWTMVDGSLWPLDKKPVGSGQYIAINDVGTVRVRKEGDRFPFILQWQRDGSNPASLESVLKRTAASLDQPVPIFPPGTLAYDARHVLIVLHDSTADEASELAEMAGGHLAVPGSRDEAGWLSEKVATVSASDGLWIGGVLDDAVWKWVTGETWSFAEWADGYPKSDGTAMTIHPGEGWHDADPSSLASGFIIEWSSDRESASSAPPEKRKVSAGNALLSKSKALVEKLDNTRQKELGANSKRMISNLETWLRRQKGSDITRWTPEVESIKDLVSGGRVPEKIGKAQGIRLSTDMAQICEEAASKQKVIDAAFMNRAMTIRDAFVARMETSKAEAETKGQAEIAKGIGEEIETAKDLEAWVGSLIGIKFQSAPLVEPLLGQWEWFDGQTLVFRANGVAERLDDSSREISWSKDPDRELGYIITWDGGSWVDTITLSDDLNGISGMNQNGNTITGSRTPKE